MDNSRALGSTSMEKTQAEINKMSQNPPIGKQYYETVDVATGELPTDKGRYFVTRHRPDGTLSDGILFYENGVFYEFKDPRTGEYVIPCTPVSYLRPVSLSDLIREEQKRFAEWIGGGFEKNQFDMWSCFNSDYVKKYNVQMSEDEEPICYSTDSIYETFINNLNTGNNEQAG